MLDLKTDKLYDSEKEDECKAFHVLQVLGMNGDNNATQVWQFNAFVNISLQRYL